MSKYILLALLSFLGRSAFSQSIAGLNFRHLYDPQNEIDFQIKLVNEKNQLTIYYALTKIDPSSAERYTIEWLRYESYTQQTGTHVDGGDSTAYKGKLSFPMPEKPWILVAKVTSTVLKNWRYMQVMDSKYPVNGYLEDNNGIVFKPYVFTGQEYSVQLAQLDKPFKVYYYRTNFSVANPPFTDRGARVDRFMFHDSSFQVAPGQRLVLRSNGLYLAQQDTAAAEGFAFLAVSGSYPKFTKIQDIPDPLVFVSTAEEHNELLAAGDDKSKVDKVILDITRDRDRAKNFMRSYFRRVELINYYFTSFKEGWKTDRGMIYLIFGLPDEVNRAGGNEIWNYKGKDRFIFVKNGSVFDPNNYILQRNAKYSEFWYSTIDLWRKSRF